MKFNTLLFLLFIWLQFYAEVKIPYPTNNRLRHAHGSVHPSDRYIYNIIIFQPVSIKPKTNFIKEEKVKSNFFSSNIVFYWQSFFTFKNKFPQKVLRLCDKCCVFWLLFSVQNNLFCLSTYFSVTNGKIEEKAQKR